MINKLEQKSIKKSVYIVLIGENDFNINGRKKE